ncbi:MAG: hypothetical protein ACSW8C_00180 [bacterium]
MAEHRNRMHSDELYADECCNGNKKADAEKDKLSKSLEKAMKPKKESSVGKGRASKLRKSQQAPKTVHVRKRAHKKNS